MPRKRTATPKPKTPPPITVEEAPAISPGNPFMSKEDGFIPPNCIPIPVELVRFVQPQDGPGFSVKTSMKHHVQGNRSSYTISYHPWVRAHWFTVEQAGRIAKWGEYISESRIATWKPLFPEPAPEPKPEA
jgi:hypothetical protein